MKKWLGLLLMSILVISVAVAGCGNNQQKKPGNDESQPQVNSEPQETSVEVTLYFSNDQATELVAEEREVQKGGETIEEIIIKELIKGPEEPGHHRTVPEEAELISVDVMDNTAYVNFTEEFQTKHWGGTTGETMTLGSIVNSLCELEGIDKVQILLEGDTMGTLAGHVDTSQPLEPSEYN